MLASLVFFPNVDRILVVLYIIRHELIGKETSTIFPGRST